MPNYKIHKQLQASQLYNKFFDLVNIHENHEREVIDLTVREIETLLGYENGRKTKIAAVCEAFIGLLKSEKEEL
jgi:CRISPR/Cas system CSM-associated protein Csm2 small subunit